MEDSGPKVGVGEIISGTFAALSSRPVPYLIYALAMTILGTAIDLFSQQASNSLVNIIGVVTGFALLQYVFAAEGMGGSRTFGSALLSYFGASLLSGLGMVIGFILLIVPGLILLSRWSIATGLVVSEDARAVDSMRRSWDLTRTSQWQIVGAYCVFGLIALGLFVVLGIAIGLTEAGSLLAESEDAPLPALASLGINAVAFAISAIGVASVLYLTKRLAASKGELEEVFA